MTTPRTVKTILRSEPTIEGAGVHLNRVFGNRYAPRFDPFLLLDEFHSSNPADYLKGFPWHPHRGIETITYVLAGEVDHGDSMGNTGVIASGDVQWMTAGGGIIHQEMPRGDEKGTLWGFQLWANLPVSHKMMPPRYREVKREQIPEVALPGGATVRVISGEIAGVRGPVTDVVIEPQYLDVTLPGGTAFRNPTPAGHTVLAYVIEGKGRFAPDKVDDALVGPGHLVVFDDGEEIVVATDNEATRLLMISGRPLREPVAWHGPIVMNTQEELVQAFDELREGTFIR